MTASRRPSPNPQTANAQQCRYHKALMRNTAASCFPSTRVTRRLNRSPGGSFSPAMLPSLLLATREKPGADKTGVEILGGARPVLLRRANSQRATMQMPQAQHHGELFPVNESCAAASVAPGGSVCYPIFWGIPDMRWRPARMSFDAFEGSGHPARGPPPPAGVPDQTGGAPVAAF